MKDIKINISGKEWLIKFNYKMSGSSFDTGTRVMVIGCRYEGDIKENLCHEILESIFAEHNLRYQQEVKEPDNGDYLFVADHRQFQNVVRDYAAVQVELSKLSREEK